MTRRIRWKPTQPQADGETPGSKKIGRAVSTVVYQEFRKDAKKYAEEQGVMFGYPAGRGSNTHVALEQNARCASCYGGINTLEKDKKKNMDSVNEEEWEPMPRLLVIDSGAAEAVIPTEWFPLHDVQEVQGSKSGVY